jgi:DnaK suppressor protein
VAKSKTTSKKTKTKSKKKTASRASSGASRSAAESGKTTAKKSTAKKSSARKSTAKKTTAKTKAKVTKAPAKKPVAKKTPNKKKTAAKNTGSKKKMAKKTTTEKTAAKTPPAKKTSTKKTVKQAPAAGKKKTTAKKPKSKRSAASARRRGQSVAEAASATEADQQGYVFINGRRVRMISTKGQAVVRKPKAAGQPTPEEASELAPVKPIKTHLSRKELNHYRNLLLATRMQLCGSLNAMEDQALNPDGGNLSHMPIHMADIDTDTFEQDFMLGLAESERQRLREIDEALKRIEDRTYGVCQMTGQPIPAARLEAKPWAKYTIEAARALEGQWGA